MRIVFDFGGVLFRWRPTELLKRALPQRATDDTTARHWVAAIFQGYGGDWGDFDRGTVTSTDLAERIAQRTGLGAHEVARVIASVPDELAQIAASVDMLRRLHAGGSRLHYLSNMPAPYADHLERTHDFLGQFESGVFSARVRLAKPDRSIFDHACDLFGARPQELVFLDDHAANVDAARAAGWQALHFSDAATCETQLRARGWWPGAPVDAGVSAAR